MMTSYLAQAAVWLPRGRAGGAVQGTRSGAAEVGEHRLPRQLLASADEAK